MATETNDPVAEMAELKRALAAVQEKIDAKFQPLFRAQAAALFEANPKLKSFGWHQYTPYFNDGDTCEFSVNRWDVDICGLNPDETDSDEFAEETGMSQEEAKSFVPQVKKFMEQFDDCDMEKAFGDHARVTIDREGITIDSYDHD